MTYRFLKMAEELVLGDAAVRVVEGADFGRQAGAGVRVEPAHVGRGRLDEAGCAGAGGDVGGGFC